MNYLTLRKRLFEIFEKAKPGDTFSKIFDIFISWLIILNILAVIFETVEVIKNSIGSFFYFFEIFSVAIFSIEYFIRVWICIEDERYKNPITVRIKYIFSFFGIIDLFAILPFYLPLIKGLDLRFIRVLRLFRLLRIFKLGRYSEAIISIQEVLNEKKEELISSFIIVALLLIFSSSIMYFVENNAQPEVFKSIPATFWWAVATLTTVGYGDVYPVTMLGKIFGGIIAILGIGMFALPTGILGAGFVEHIQKKKKEQKIRCPNCGKIIEIEK